MGYVSRDFDINSKGRISLITGADVPAQKVEKMLYLYLKKTVGTTSPAGLVAIDNLIRRSTDILIQVQNSSITLGEMTPDERIKDIVDIEVSVEEKTHYEASMRVVLEDGSFELIMEGNLV